MTLIIKTTGLEDYLDGGEGRVKALIMGSPGAGKTRSASFWPSPFLADCEDGRMSVADRKMPYARITSSQDMHDLLNLLELEAKKPDSRYKTLIIDTLDSYQRVVIQERLNATGNESLSGWADWGYLDAKMQILVSRLQSLPMNIVVNLHVKETKVGEDEDGKGGYLVTGPKLKGDLRDQIAAEFDLVGHMGTYWEARDGERVQVRGIQWWPDPSRPILKDRSGKLPRWTEVSFTEDDYTNLFMPLVEALNDLAPSEVVQEVPTDAAEPVKPTRGGAVKTAAAPKKTTAAPAKAAAPATPPAQPSTTAAAPAAAPAATPAAPAAAAPVPAAPRPVVPAAPKPVVTTPEQAAEAVPTATEVPTSVATESGADAAPEAAEAPAAEPEPEAAAVSEEQAVAAVQEGLGGEVISQEPAVDSAPAEPEVAPTSPEPAAEQEQADGVKSFVAMCGTTSDGQPADPSKPGGCGKSMNATGVNGQLLSVEGEKHDLVQIAFLRHRIWLCNACFAASRAATQSA